MKVAASLRRRAARAYAETYLTTLPILSPSLGGLWMQIAPKALWARFVSWVTSPGGREEQEGDVASEIEWAEDVVPCLLDPDQPRYLSSAQAAAIVNEHLRSFEAQTPLSDSQRSGFIQSVLLEIPWA